MKTTNIFAIIAAGVLALNTTACSDNLDSELEPVETERTLTVKLQDSGTSEHTLNLGAAPSTTIVNVESNTRWTVEVSECLGGWCDVDIINGAGNGSFSIKVLDNMKDVRDCYVTIYKTNSEGEKETDGSFQIKVKQEVSDVRLSPSSLAPFAPELNERQKFDIISNVAWTLNVTYEGESSIKFVTITPANGVMEEEADGTFRGTGEASFYLEVQNNRTAADRKAYINLKSAVANYSVELTQLKSEYTFDVSPAESRTVPAKGGQIDFGVLSLSDWTVATAADWITFTNEAGTSSETRQNTTAIIKPNTSGWERSAEIRFKPEDKNYPEQSVTVTQLGYDLTFAVSSNDNPGVLMDSGSSFTIDLDSRFDWTVSTPDWIRAAPSYGSASAEYSAIRLTADYNYTMGNRNGTVTVTPHPTQFDGGVTLDPTELGIEPIKIGITQFGGKEPAISIPWLADGYGQTSATVEFSYYSPFYEITEAGLLWRKVGSDDWITVNVKTSDPIDGMVSVTLTDLTPATQYEACGFVKDNIGRTIRGSVSYPFTTGGKRPGANDNPTPSTDENK